MQIRPRRRRAATEISSASWTPTEAPLTTRNVLLWWLGALAVAAALLINVLAIAILRAVRAGASLT